MGGSMETQPLFWTFFCGVVLVCRNDRASLEKVLGIKLDNPSGGEIRALVPYLGTWNCVVRSSRNVCLISQQPMKNFSRVILPRRESITLYVTRLSIRKKSIFRWKPCFSGLFLPKPL